MYSFLPTRHLSNVDIDKLLNVHFSSKKLLTVTAVRPPARFGELNISGDGHVASFVEKPQLQTGWINGGFMVCNKSVINYIEDESEMFEREPISRLISDSQVHAHQHSGFWQCMDSKRDYDYLNELWNAGDAPWKTPH